MPETLSDLPGPQLAAGPSEEATLLLPFPLLLGQSAGARVEAGEAKHNDFPSDDVHAAPLVDQVPAQVQKSIEGLGHASGLHSGKVRSSHRHRQAASVPAGRSQPGREEIQRSPAQQPPKLPLPGAGVWDPAQWFWRFCSSSSQATLETPAPLSSNKEDPGFPWGVGPEETMKQLAFDFRHNCVFRGMVKQLDRHGYRTWRRVRGDGNCLYRAVGFGVVEQMASADEPTRTLWLDSLLRCFATVQFESPTEAEAHRHLLERLEGLRPERLGQKPPGEWLEGWRKELCQPYGSLDLAVVRCLRKLAAETLERHQPRSDFGTPPELVIWALGYKGIEDFSHQIVRPLGAEADSLSVMALSLAIGVVLRVALLDRSHSDAVVYGNYPSELNPPSGCPIVHLQLRPGHFELLCTPERGTPAFQLASNTLLLRSCPSRSSSSETLESEVLEGAEAARDPGLCLGWPASWDALGIQDLEARLRSAASQALELSEVGLVALRCEVAEASQAGLAALAGALAGSRGQGSAARGPAQETLGPSGPTPQLTLEA